MPQKSLECSSRGDRRFSSYYARITINGVEDSIEHFYQKAKRREDGRSASKSGTRYDHFICPYTGSKFTKRDAPDFFKGLWVAYFKQHPELIAYAKCYDTYTDMFRDKNEAGCDQSSIIAAFIQDNEKFMTDLRNSRWYKNLSHFYGESRQARDATTEHPSSTNQERPTQEQHIDCEAILRDYAKQRDAARSPMRVEARTQTPQSINKFDRKAQDARWLMNPSCSLDVPYAPPPTPTASEEALFQWLDSLTVENTGTKAGKGKARSKDEYAVITAKISISEVVELFNEGDLRLEDILQDIKDLLVSARVAQEKAKHSQQ